MSKMLIAAWMYLICSIVAFVSASGCGAHQAKPTLEQALQATVIAADASYGLVVELCDAREREIIQRPPATLEQDKEDLAHIRDACDRIFTVFDETRRLKLLIDELGAL